MRTVQAYVCGRVQGVGYREFVRRQAARLGVNGWVKNLPDGRVHALLQAEPDRVEELLHLLRQGPQLARVEQVEIEEQESAPRCERFRVLWGSGT